MLAHAYEYVCAIDTYRNMSAAAASLCITQPALTKYINRLEASLGVRLVDRSVSPVSLTDAGEKFVAKARIILEMEQELLRDLSRITSGTRGILTLGMTTEMCSVTLPHFYARMRQMYPEIQIQLTEGNERFLLEELSRGKIELAVLPTPAAADHLILDCIQVEPVILAMPADHPIAQSFDLSSNSPLTPYYLEPERLKHGDFVVCKPELGMGRHAREMFRKYRLQPNIVLEVRRNETALRMASSGLGIVFTPIKTTLRVPMIRPMAYFSIENPITTRSRCICRSGQAVLSEAAKCFIPVMKKVFAEVPELLQPVCQLIHQPRSK